jgi:hypothetical protein
MRMLWMMMLAAWAVLPACAATAPARSPHPFDESLEGQWYYECRSFLIDESFPISLRGFAIYFEGRTHERLDVFAGSECADAARYLTLRFRGTYTLGSTVSVRLGSATVQAVRNEEIKQSVTYELTSTFASVAGDDPDCQALVGKRWVEGGTPALARCGVTKDFRELEERTRRDRTLLYVDRCRLVNGDSESPKDTLGYPTALDTRYWGLRPCPDE